jgi:hypothetical protein
MGFNFTTQHYEGVYNTTRLGDGRGNRVGTLRNQPLLAMYDLMGLRLSEPDQQWVKGTKPKREAYLSVLKLSRYFTGTFVPSRAGFCVQSINAIPFAFWLHIACGNLPLVPVSTVSQR